MESPATSRPSMESGLMEFVLGMPGALITSFLYNNLQAASRQRSKNFETESKQQDLLTETKV
ncbi:hypothetical protein E4U52_001191 [Claviceps spartinae]|nr:hypothetical protein E4U52_001191 [Claviceps spartinae]